MVIQRRASNWVLIELCSFEVHLLAGSRNVMLFALKTLWLSTGLSTGLYPVPLSRPFRRFLCLQSRVCIWWQWLQLAKLATVRSSSVLQLLRNLIAMSPTSPWITIGKSQIGIPNFPWNRRNRVHIPVACLWCKHCLLNIVYRTCTLHKRPAATSIPVHLNAN